jgi:hypothetical protein
MGPTQPPIQWVPGTISLGIKLPGREADYSPPASAEVKNGGAIPPLPYMPSWHNALLFKHRDVTFSPLFRSFIYLFIYLCTYSKAKRSIIK